MGRTGLCPCCALQGCAALTFPHWPGAATWFSWPLCPWFLCRWGCGHLAWQGSPAPSGIYRHIMPSRGQSFFPSHGNTWHPCCPSITGGDSAASSLWFMGFPILLWVVCTQTRPRLGNYLAEMLDWWLQLFPFNKPAGFFLSCLQSNGLFLQKNPSDFQCSRS